MESPKISDLRIYELALESKHHEETRRDEISKYYTALFTGIVSIMPFMEKFINIKDKNADVIQNFKVMIIVLSLSFIGMVISGSWMMTLKRIYNYIEGIDKLLIKIEESAGKEFIIFMSNYLYSIDSPNRVTKQTMWLPFIFMMIFGSIFLYNAGYIIWERYYI